ncbi:MAG: DUF1552 domain-containing protein [Pseudomonadota bacterium]
MTNDQKMALEKRRDFLKFLGTTGLSLPLLQASSLGAGILLSRQAEAQGVATRRVIFVYVPDGTPHGAASSFLPTSGMTMNKCSMPFEPVKSQCIFFSGTSVEGGGGHGNSQRVLGAFAPGVRGTIDLALGDSVGSTSPTASLRLGVATYGKEPVSARSYAGATDVLDNPKTAFDKLFGGGVDNTSIGTKRELKLLELNQAALAKIKTKLGTYELQRLQQHEASIAKLRADIQAASGGGGAGSCTSAVWNSGGLSTSPDAINFTDLFALQTENIVMAMKCNLTRIATLQLGTHQGDFKATGMTMQLHGDAVHNPGSSSGYGPHHVYRTYFSERIAHLIKRLAETDDPIGGKLIDSTLLLQVTDMGDGNAHSASDAPFMMAGGGSAVNRGRVVNVSNHHQLLDTVSQYMGAYASIPHYASSPASGILR